MLTRRIQRIGATAVLAGCLLGGCGNRDADETPTDAGGGGRVGDPAGRNKPALEFPKHLRCDNEAVNRFIEEFYRVCYLGEYDNFRLMMSSRVDPFTPERFKRALTAVELVQIEGIEKLPDVADAPPPIYLVRSRVQLRPNVKNNETEKTIAILVLKEGGKWVMVPAPKELRGGLDALKDAEETLDVPDEQADQATPGVSEPSDGES